MADKKFNPLPGFRLTMGCTLFYLSVLVLIPIGGLFLNAFQLPWTDLWQLVTDARALAAYRLTFGAALIAACINVAFGTLLAWILVRHQFIGKRFVDALVDFPLALPTAVAGLTLATLFSTNGWLGRWLEPLGVKAVYSPLAVVIALTFVGLPFVVRTLQPVLLNMEPELEEAAATLGASRSRIFLQVLAPTLLPAALTGFAMAFARAVGEYGSVVFVSGNLPYRTEIAPCLIMFRLEQYDYAGATAIAAVLLIISVAILVGINRLETWMSRLNA